MISLSILPFLKNADTSLEASRWHWNYTMIFSPSNPSPPPYIMAKKIFLIRFVWQIFEMKNNLRSQDKAQSKQIKFTKLHSITKHLHLGYICISYLWQNIKKWLIWKEVSIVGSPVPKIPLHHHQKYSTELSDSIQCTPQHYCTSETS